MIDIHVCIGSACHLKGSYFVIETLQKLIKRDQLETQVIIKAAFCLGHCTEAVSIRINDEEIMSVTPGSIDSFYTEQILGRIKL